MHYVHKYTEEKSETQKRNEKLFDARSIFRSLLNLSQHLVIYLNSFRAYFLKRHSIC